MSDLRGYLDFPRPAERLPEPSEHHKVSVERHPIEPANAERGEAVVVLQAAELALNACATTVDPLPPAEP